MEMGAVWIYDEILGIESYGKKVGKFIVIGGKKRLDGKGAMDWKAAFPAQCLKTCSILSSFSPFR